MKIPDKLKKYDYNTFKSDSKGHFKFESFDYDNGLVEKVVLPRWLSDEINDLIRDAQRDGGNSVRSDIKKALGL